ncbi:MAG: hypothetical protein RDU20_12265 [Desulfomonilaceae bacterium]|nr:hypothetical protein [Desulfomonilaceae bacterium]
MKQERSDDKQRPLLAHESLHWIIALAFTGLAAVLANRLGTDWFEAGLIVATGALAGYLTSDMAITILLWPTEPKLGGMLQGVFFKRRDVFGNTLIDRSCEKFLNPELFTKLIQDPAVEDALHSSVRSAIIDLASRELVTPRSFLSSVLPEREHREELFDRIAAALGNHAAQVVFDNSSEERIFRLLRVGLDNIGHTQVTWFSDRERIATLIERIVAEHLTEGAFASFEEWATKKLSRLLNSSNALGELVPGYVQRQMEDMARTYALTVILREIGSLLADDGFRAKIVPLIQKEVDELLQSKIAGIDGFKGWLLRTFGKKTVNELLATLPKDLDRFLNKIPEFIERPEFKEYLGTAIVRLISGLWGLRLRDLHALMPPDFVRYVVESGAGLIRSESVCKEISMELAQFLSRFEGRELNTLAPALFHHGETRDRALKFISARISQVLADPATRSSIYPQSRILMRRWVVSFLDAPLPKIIDLPFVKSQGVEALAVAAGDVVTDRLREYGPSLVERFPIRERLQDLWNAMTNEQMQESILSVMEDQFKILINLGISYGAAVGFLSLILQGVSGTFGTIMVWGVLLLAYRVFKYKEVERRW